MELMAIIEIPAGSTFKYEHDKETNSLVLDRPLNQPVPFNYGYFDATLCDDGDPLDIFILSSAPIYPLARVKIEIVGVLKCEDGGYQDDKILAYIVGDKQHGYDLASSEIENYLKTYKPGFEVLGLGNKEEAIEIYNKSVEDYNYWRECMDRYGYYLSKFQK